MASNLPPGVSESDIPGNRASDAAWDRFLDWANDKLLDLESIEEAKRAILIGIAAVDAEHGEYQKAVEIGVRDQLEIIRERAIEAEELAMEGGADRG